MKNIFYLILVSLLVSCGDSSEDDSPIIKDDFKVTITSQKNTVVIDEVVALTVAANENLKSIKITDGIDADFSVLPNNSSTETFYFKFDTLGAKTLNIECVNSVGELLKKSFQINVERGNAIKINSLKIVSFQNINQTWDSEYSDTDVNRLADVVFVLLKPKVDVLKATTTNGKWYQSSIKQNQGDLLWNLSSFNLYINPNLSLFIGLADDDGTYKEDLLMGPPSELGIKLSDYVTTKPTIIKLTKPEINLEIELSVEWP